VLVLALALIAAYRALGAWHGGAPRPSLGLYGLGGLIAGVALVAARGRERVWARPAGVLFVLGGAGAVVVTLLAFMHLLPAT
jgi:hypothetical protein